jgi:5-methylcytosine-specific restriction endonuclease McrA
MKRRVCNYCKRLNHTSLNCYRKRIDKNGQDVKNRKKLLKKESKNSMQKRQILRTTFFNKYPANMDGTYTCYLQISLVCPKRLDRPHVTLEHTYSRQKYPELKYIPENILPACEACNKVKMSNTPEQLAIFFPNIKEWLESNHYREFKDKLNNAIKQRNIQLYWNQELNKYVRYE